MSIVTIAISHSFRYISENVVARHGLKMHQYADVIQIHAYTTVNDADCFAACLTDVEASLRASLAAWKMTGYPTVSEFRRYI